MTEPTATTVRLATASDADGIMACLRLMHQENGLFPLSEPRVRDVIDMTLHPRPDVSVPPMIGVVGPQDDIQATVCIMLTRLYYTEDWHLGDLWNFIRPDCRHKMYINALLAFSKECSDKVGIPLMSAVVSNKRTEAKVRIYQRHFGAPLGALFLYRPHQIEAR